MESTVHVGDEKKPTVYFLKNKNFACVRKKKFSAKEIHRRGRHNEKTNTKFNTTTTTTTTTITTSTTTTTTTAITTPSLNTLLQPLSLLVPSLSHASHHPPCALPPPPPLSIPSTLQKKRISSHRIPIISFIFTHRGIPYVCSYLNRLYQFYTLLKLNVCHTMFYNNISLNECK